MEMWTTLKKLKLDQPRLNYSATPQLQAQNTPPSAQKQSKSTDIAKAAIRQFSRMENEVQQALAVMDKQTG